MGCARAGRGALFLRGEDLRAREGECRGRGRVTEESGGRLEKDLKQEGGLLGPSVSASDSVVEDLPDARS